MSDLFEQIKHIEKGDLDFNQLSVEEQKEINPYMLLKWMSYTSDPKQILHMNALVNPKVFALYKHKALSYKLLVSASSGKHYHYKWLKRGNKNSSAVVNMISDAHNCGIRDAIEILDLYSKEELLDLCSEMNYDKAEADKVKKEINVLRV